MSRIVPIAVLLGSLAGCQPSADCPSGMVPCGGGCIRTGTELNCGACGDACAPGMVCRAGACACPYGLLRCDGRCVDPASDPTHCGACGVTCGEADCVRGACQCASGTLCDGVCVDTSADDQHCGACDRACEGERTCVGGACTCPPGELDCGEACVDAQVDLDHCGGCGVRCSPDRACAEGACVCRSGTSCPDGCRDLTRDEMNCGACGAACAALVGDTCRVGRCVPALSWVRTQRAGNRYFDIGRDTALAAAPDGGVFASWGVDSNYSTSVHVAKLSPSGDEIWHQQLFGGYRSAPSGMAVRPGQVVVAIDGGTLVALDDATGAPVFSLSLGESVDDVAAAPDGSVVVVGHFRGSITLGAQTFGSRGHRDLFLARVDASGNITQAHTFGGIADDMDVRVAVDASTGTIYLAGHTGAGLSLGGPMLGRTVAGFLGALAPDGTHVFSMRLEIEDVHEIDAVPGGVALLGWADRSANVAGVMLDAGLFVGVWDAAGTARWVTGLRAAPDYRHEGGIVHGEGVVYVTSGFWGEVVIGGTRLSDTDRRDVFLGALRARDGAGLWVAGFGGLDDDDAHAIVFTPGAITISGRFGQTVDFGGESRAASSSAEDSFVVRYRL